MDRKTLFKKIKKMVILFFAITSFFLPATTLAGSWNGWIYQNPYPTANILLAVKFITPQKGWIAGEKGTILYTEDGGDTWEYQESGTEQDIKSLAFVNEKTGWAVGNGGTIIHTEDGGKTWKPQGDVDESASLNKVFFINEKEGWIVGATPMGVVLHTTDSGKKWEKTDIGTNRSIASIYFFNPQTGWILAGDEVYSTRDGGKKWEKVNLDIKISRPTKDEGGRPVLSMGGERIEPDWWQGDIYFADENNGWAVFGLWYMAHTKDGGKTWKTDETGFSVRHISFRDEKTGCTAGSSILCTEDGGKTWTERLGIKSNESSTISLWGFSFVDKKVGWAVGKEGYIEGHGKIFKTEDGGMKWKAENRNPTISSIYFIDAKIGWAQIYNSTLDRHSIVKTDDGGDTWKVQKEFDTRANIRFFFNSPTTGWVVGQQWGQDRSGDIPLNYLILHTTDGGKTWNNQFNEKIYQPKKLAFEDGLFDVFFINPKVGWAIGSRGLILYTTDGGKNWVRQKSGTKSELRRIQFIDDKKGWIIGNKVKDGRGTIVILHTDDGGEHWHIQWKREGGWMWLHDLQFIDENTGWVMGAINEYSGDGIIVHTADGGKTWSEKEFKEINYRHMGFLDRDQGVILTKKGLMLTYDGGKTWNKQLAPIHQYPWHISEIFNKK